MNLHLPKAHKQQFIVSRSIQVPAVGGKKMVHVPRPQWWKRLSCKDVDCPAYLNGFDITLPVDRQDLIETIRHDRSRHYTEAKAGDGLIQFKFPPVQNCFKHEAHLRPVVRDPIFLHHANGSQRQMDYDQFFYRMNEEVKKTEDCRRG